MLNIKARFRFEVQKMLDDERIQDLQNAFEVLVKHNLYRRGACDIKTLDITPKEIGEAIDMAAGNILEYFMLKEEYDRAVESKKTFLKQAQGFYSQWKNAEKTVILLVKRLDTVKAENKRLRALLAGHKIKYKRVK